MVEINIKKEYLALFFILTFAFFISSYNADGLSLDSDSLCTAIRIMYLMKHGVVSCENPYTGLNILIIPFFLFFGFIPFAFYIAQSFFLTIGVLSTYSLGKRFYNDERVGLLAAFMLSVFPGYILMKLHEYPFIPFIIILTTLFFYKFYKTKKIRNLQLAGIVCGFATYFKIISMYFFIAIIFSFVVIFFLYGKEKTKRNFLYNKSFIEKIKYLMVFTMFFLVGFSPIFWDRNHNLIKFGIERLEYIVVNGTHGKEFFSGELSLSNRMEYFRRILDHDAVTIRGDTYPIQTKNNFRYAPELIGLDSGNLNFDLFLISIVFLIIFLRYRRDYFITMVVFFYILFIIITPHIIRQAHLTPLLPFFMVIIARFMIVLYDRRNVVYKSFFLLILIGYTLQNSISLYDISQTLNNQTFLETSSNYNHLPKVHTLVFDYLENASKIVTAQQPHPFTMLYFVNNERKEIIQLCDIQEWIENLTNKLVMTADCSNSEIILNETFQDPEVRYLFPTSLRIGEEKKLFEFIFCCTSEECGSGCWNGTYYIPFLVFRDYAKEKNKTMILEHLIEGATGPVYEIYKIE